MAEEWRATACILCAANCGMQVQLSEDGRSFARIRGDAAHPGSKGYLCNKASRLNHYQNRADRLTSPMRRRADGSYEAVDWDVAIAEVAARLAAVRDRHGGASIFYYGGGGQGNHLPGVHAGSTLAALGAKYRSNALAQEKTGEFWVAQRMLGHWAHGDFEHCQVAIFLGKNPWQSHGIQRARATLREIAKDPNRTLIVIDPKRTESADLADVHLEVRPARDAWLLAAIAAALVQEDLIAHAWLDEHTRGADAVISMLGEVDIAEHARKCGIDEGRIREVARLIAAAKSVAVFEDLGVQMNRHSTLVSYLQRLLWLLTGHFGRPGTHYIPNGIGNFGSGEEAGRTPVTGHRIISSLVPCNVIPDEVLTDHPDRFRAMIIESVNPVHSLADSPRWRETMRTLEFSVVIDVAMTESALQADYVLPTSTQYEKAEATFFNFEFPDNYFHVRPALFEAPAGVLPEGEIHARLVEALGALDPAVVSELRGALSAGGRGAFRAAVFERLAQHPELAGVAPAILHRTLSETLPPELANAAPLWALCQRYAASRAAVLNAAGIEGEGPALGDAMFDALLTGPTAVVISRETWADVWRRVPGGRINLELPDMLEAARALAAEEPGETSEAYPFLLSAGERRAFTANCIIRDPDWRKKDADGALHINPEDARRLNLGDGSTARLSTRRGSVEVVVELCDRMQAGHVSLPNGLGMAYRTAEGEVHAPGAAPNELTWAEHRDPFAGTPWHKSVPVRIEAV